MRISDKQLYLVIAACAVVVHLGSLWNRFALDDNYIILFNPLVHSISGIWQAFLHPYWPADLGGKVYRPLVVATYAVDWQFSSTMWFHAVNLLWHAGTGSGGALPEAACRVRRNRRSTTASATCAPGGRA